jgi:hypothetical protein
LAGLGKQGSKGRTDRSAFVRRRSSRVRGIASDVGPRPQESSRHTGRAPVELAPLYAAALTPSKGRLIPLHHAAISRKRSPTNSPACRGRRTFRPGSLVGTGRAALSRATITPGRWVFHDLAVLIVNKKPIIAHVSKPDCGLTEATFYEGSSESEGGRAARFTGPNDWTTAPLLSASAIAADQATAAASTLA